jgi:hypothetical protein
VLLFGILAIAANAQALSKPGDVDLSFVFSRGLQPLLVGVLVLGIGVSLGVPPATRSTRRATSRRGSRTPYSRSRQRGFLTGATPGFPSSGQSSAGCWARWRTGRSVLRLENRGGHGKKRWR